MARHSRSRQRPSATDVGDRAHPSVPVAELPPARVSRPAAAGSHRRRPSVVHPHLQPDDVLALRPARHRAAPGHRRRVPLTRPGDRHFGRPQPRPARRHPRRPRPRQGDRSDAASQGLHHARSARPQRTTTPASTRQVALGPGISTALTSIPQIPLRCLATLPPQRQGLGRPADRQLRHALRQPTTATAISETLPALVCAQNAAGSPSRRVAALGGWCLSPRGGPPVSVTVSRGFLC